MSLSPKARATAIQHSIEAGAVPAAGLVHPARYRQHNPHVADGLAAIRSLHALLPHEHVYTNVVRAFEDDLPSQDLVNARG